MAGASAPGRYCGCGGHSPGSFSRWWQIESPYRADARYRPVREPRFLLFEKSAELPRIAVAPAPRGEFPEAPGLPEWLHRRHLESRR